MSEHLKQFTDKYKKYWFVPLLVVIGVLLMLYKNEQPTAVQAVKNEVYNQSFVEETEMRIEEMLQDIEGIGICKVTITLASGGRKEYVREEGQVLVITDKDGNQSPVISKESAPEIAGVTVLCSGKANPNVKNDIIYSVGTVLGIGTNKICVVLSNGE